MARFDFDACVPLVIDGVTISEDLECEVLARYDPVSDCAVILQIDIREQGNLISLSAKSTTPLHRALWDALVPVIDASAAMDAALSEHLDENDLRVPVHGEHRLTAAQLGVGRFA